MSDAQAREMLKKYSRSLYFREGGTALATRTPPPTAAELVAGQVSNVEDAKHMRDRIRRRMQEAEEDGLFDTDALETVSERVQEQWIRAIDMMAGDKVRALAELRHWREYSAWSMRETQGKIVEREPGSDDE